MSSSEKFCLKWNDFQVNISSSFCHMRKDPYFSDVTLVCDGDVQIEAHKVILAGSSTFFSRLLKQNKHTHPLFYMRGINASQLSSVVDFIYLGQVNIFQEDLDAFLNLAEELQLKGLNGHNTHQKEPIQKPTMIKPDKVMNKTNQYTQETQYKSNTAEEISQLHCETSDLSNQETSMVLAATALKTSTNYKELDETINSMMSSLGQGQYSCNVCGKIEPKKKSNMKNHIEGKHIEGVSHPCSHCGNTFRSKEALWFHIFRHHQDVSISQSFLDNIF